MKRAVWRGSVVALAGTRDERVGQWLCYHDGQALVGEGGYHVQPSPDLVPLPEMVDGLPAYGLPSRTRVHGKSTRGGWKRASEPVLPIYVYCPRRECGRGQRVG